MKTKLKNFLKRSLTILGIYFLISMVVGTPFLLLLKHLGEIGFKLSVTKNLSYIIFFLGLFFALMIFAKNLILGIVLENEKKPFSKLLKEFFGLVIFVFILSLLAPGILFWTKGI